MASIQDFIEDNKSKSNTAFAKNLFQEMEQETINWDGDKISDYVKVLVEKKVNINQLLSQYGEKIFDSDNREKLLLEFHNQWVKEDDLYSDEIQLRQTILRQAYVSRKPDSLDNLKSIIQNKDIPLYIVDALSQKPLSMPHGEYGDFIETLLKGCDGVRKMEICTLALKNCMIYENAFYVEEDVDASSDIKEEFINLKEFKKVNPSLYNELNAHSLIGSGYENSIKDDLGIKQAKQALLLKVQTSANKVRNQLKQDNQLKALNDKTQKVLESAYNSGRLQRTCKKYVMKKLRESKKTFSAAVAITEGLNGEQNMVVKMMLLYDSKTCEYIRNMMSEVISELENEYNLNPNFFKGILLKSAYTFASYPEAMFYTILDFLALCSEYIIKYTEKAAHFVYDKVTGNKNAREEREIYGKKDIEDAINSVRNAIAGVDLQIEITPEAKLRNDIINCIKDNKHNDIVAQDGLNEKVKEKLTEALTYKGIDRKKALYDILKMPEMNQGITAALPKLADGGKAIGLISQI